MSQQTQTRGAPAPAFRMARLSNLIPILALVVFGTLFVRHLATLDMAEVWRCLGMFSLWQWAATIVLTGLSFRAIGTYDVLVHRVLNTGQTATAARRAGIKAIALSQTLGFGALTSALVRWRCLPDLSAISVARLSAVVSLSFLVALAVVAAAVVPLSGLAPYSGAMIAVGVSALVALIALARLAHRLGWIPAPVKGCTLGALLIATAADTGFAAAALWVFWPDMISLHTLFAAYLVALGAGLVSNAPGGVGAFDLTLLALVPVTDDAAAMASLLAFRLTYYALPATVALISLLRPPPTVHDHPLTHAEADLVMVGANKHLHRDTALLTLPCIGAGAVLGDLPAPLKIGNLGWGDPQAIYKCGPFQAADARRAGWAALRCAHEARIDLRTWDLNTPARRQLRRNLRAFDASGLNIREVRDASTLAGVAAAWVRSHGRERGLSMGRFDEAYLRQQRVFAAYDGQTPIAFVSFHTGPVWTLDLMRHLDAIPKGVMHALVHSGIDAATQAGATDLSLAAVPAPEPHLPFAAASLANASGLRRFKAAFAPNWQPRYICAKGRLRLVLTMATLAYNIHRPAPLTNPVQTEHEDYSFAPAPHSCDPHLTLAGASPNDQRPFQTSQHS